MRSATLALLPLILVGVGLQTAAAQLSNADSAVNACLAADTATRWLAVRAAWASDSGHTWSNDSLRGVLLDLGRADQAVRSAGGLADSMADPDFGRRMAAADSTNGAALRAIIDRFGWPTRSLVGVEGASAAFLIAQHSPALQHEALTLMRALPPGEVSPGDLAMLEDRVRVHDGQPQRYGTHLSLDSTGPIRFDPIEDLEHLDARRAEAGLPPIPVYTCMMRAVYGRDVVWPPGSGREP